MAEIIQFSNSKTVRREVTEADPSREEEEGWVAQGQEARAEEA